MVFSFPFRRLSLPDLVFVLLECSRSLRSCVNLEFDEAISQGIIGTNPRFCVFSLVLPPSSEVTYVASLILTSMLSGLIPVMPKGMSPSTFAI